VRIVLKATAGMYCSTWAARESSSHRHRDYTLDYTKFVLTLSDKRPGMIKSGLIDSNDDGVITGFTAMDRTTHRQPGRLRFPQRSTTRVCLDFRIDGHGSHPELWDVLPGGHHAHVAAQPTLYTEAEGGTSDRLRHRHRERDRRVSVGM